MKAPECYHALRYINVRVPASIVPQTAPVAKKLTKVILHQKLIAIKNLLQFNTTRRNLRCFRYDRRGCRNSFRRHERYEKEHVSMSCQQYRVPTQSNTRLRMTEESRGIWGGARSRPIAVSTTRRGRRPFR